MIYPTTTAFYAAILGLIYAGLSAWVIGGRVTGNVLLDPTILVGSKFFTQRIMPKAA